MAGFLDYIIYTFSDLNYNLMVNCPFQGYVGDIIVGLMV